MKFIMMLVNVLLLLLVVVCFVLDNLMNFVLGILVRKFWVLLELIMLDSFL